MKKAVAPSGIPVRYVLRLSWLEAGDWSIHYITHCLVAFLRLQSYSYEYQHYSSSESELSSPSSLIHHRSRLINTYHFKGNAKKIAFLFLARMTLPLDFLWGSFFESADASNFSVYIHAEPGFVFDESTTKSAFFYNCQLKNSIKVAWGESSMIDAERLLLGAALDDPANHSFLDKKEGRYNRKMSPIMPKNKWGKGSQWITLIWKHVKVIVDDEVIFPIFQKFCKRHPPMDASKGKQNLKLQKQHNRIPDEHYVQTLLAIGFFGC